MAQYEEKVTKFNELMKDHNDWMRNSINLIASENVTSSAVKTAMVSDLSHRYAEGQAYERFYQGCTYIDEIEDITKKLSCELYDCTYANVQPVSGVTANWKIGDMSGEAEILNDASINFVAYDGRVGRYYMQCQNTLPGFPQRCSKQKYAY